MCWSSVRSSVETPESEMYVAIFLWTMTVSFCLEGGIWVCGLWHPEVIGDHWGTVRSRSDRQEGSISKRGSIGFYSWFYFRSRCWSSLHSSTPQFQAKQTASHRSAIAYHRNNSRLFNRYDDMDTTLSPQRNKCVWVKRMTRKPKPGRNTHTSQSSQTGPESFFFKWDRHFTQVTSFRAYIWAA